MSKYVKPMLLTEELNGGVNIGGWSGENFGSDDDAPRAVLYDGQILFLVPWFPGKYCKVENGKFVPYIDIP